MQTIDNKRFTRVPKIGQSCEITGLSRTTFSKILATGQVQTHSVQFPGNSRGSRLVDVQSLLEFIERCPAKPVAQKGGAFYGSN